MSRLRSLLFPALLGSAMELLVLLFDRIDPQSPGQYLALHGGLWLLWTAALGAAGLLPFAAPLFPRGVSFPAVGILGFSLLFQVSLIGTEPVLETDPYRYLLDGRTVAALGNPYALAPEDVSFPPGEDPPWYFEWINHPHLRTIYPPVSQLLFGLAALLQKDSLAAWQALCVAWNLLAALGTLSLLRSLGRGPEALLLTAWNPLFLKEYANTAHADAAMLCFGVWAAAFLARRRDAAAALLLALATLAKLSYVLLLPLFVRFARRPAAFLLFPAAVALGYAPFVLTTEPSRVFESLGTYLRDWWFFSFLFEGFLRIFRGAFGLSWEAAALGARALGGLLVLAVLAAALRGKPQVEEFLRRLFWVLTAALLANQTVFPWYVGWALAFSPFLPGRWTPVLWSGLAPLSYLYFLADADVTPVRLLAYFLLSTAVLLDLRKEPWWFPAKPGFKCRVLNFELKNRKLGA